MNDIYDTSIKSIKSIKSIIVSLNSIKDLMIRLGKKEYICWFIFGKIMSPDSIDKKLNLPKTTTRLIINRNQNLFELDHKEAQTKFWKLSQEGIKFVESKLQEYEEAKKKAEKVAEEITKNKKQTQIKKLETEDFLEVIKDYLQTKIKPHQHYVEIDFRDLEKELQDKLLEEPEEFLQLCKCAVEEEIDFNFINIPTKTKLSEVDTNYLNKLVSIDAVIKITGNVVSLSICTRFECPACGNNISILQISKELRTPGSCTCGRRGHFKVVSHEKVNKMDLLIEEFLEDLQDSQQKSLRLEILKKSLTNYQFRKKLIPGTKVNIVGIVKEKEKYLKGRGNKISTESEFYLEANNIKFLEEIDIDIFDKEAEKEIKNISKDINKNGLIKVVKSFAPHIHGLEDIKESIIYQAVTPKSKNARRTLNVLIVGDTATAKSDLFMFAEDNIIRSITATEDNSVAGLTIGLIRDEFFETGTWIASPGILPRANNSVAILDEIDKYGEEVTMKLHSAMSRLKVSVSKIKNLTLPADTCILAGSNPFAVNPFKQHNPKNWNSTFNIPQSMVNRYDLVFNLQDIPNEEIDRKISKLMHKKEEGLAFDKHKHYKPLLLKKFLFYIKQQPTPSISKENHKLIEDFVLRCRARKKDFEEVLPITARLNEALLTISKCSAKLRMSKEVNEKDIESAKSLIIKSFKRNGLVL